MHFLIFSFFFFVCKDRQNEGPSFARGKRSPLGSELGQKLPKATVGKSVYQVPPKEAPLNGPKNETEFTGKRINTEIGIVEDLQHDITNFVALSGQREAF